MFISLLLSSDNVLLEKIYLNDILVLWKDKREYVVEEIEISSSSAVITNHIRAYKLPLLESDY